MKRLPKLPQHNEDELRTLGALRVELLRQLDEVERQLNPLIAAACAKLVPQETICEWTGYKPSSRDKIRRIAREHGVEPRGVSERTAHARQIRAAS